MSVPAYAGILLSEMQIPAYASMTAVFRSVILRRQWTATNRKCLSINFLIDKDMQYCKNCGNQVTDGVRFCISCGAAMTVEEPAIAATNTSPSPVAPVQPLQRPVQPAQTPVQTRAEVYKEEPVSTGGYFGIMFLLMIPLLNLLLLIIWACGGCRKVNKRNYARAVLLWFVVGSILSALIVLAGGLLFGNAFNELKETIMQILNS